MASEVQKYRNEREKLFFFEKGMRVVHYFIARVLLMEHIIISLLTQHVNHMLASLLARVLEECSSARRVVGWLASGNKTKPFWPNLPNPIWII